MSLWSADGATLFVGDPSPVTARVYNSAAQTIAGGGATTVLDFNTTDFVAGHSTAAPTVDLSANSITIVQPGYYIVRGAVSIDSSGGAANYTMNIVKDGVAWSIFYLAANVGNVSLQTHKFGYFAKGAVVTLNVIHDGGSSHPTIAGTASLSLYLMR